MKYCYKFICSGYVLPKYLFTGLRMSIDILLMTMGYTADLGNSLWIVVHELEVSMYQKSAL